MTDNLLLQQLKILNVMEDLIRQLGERVES